MCRRLAGAGIGAQIDKVEIDAHVHVSDELGLEVLLNGGHGIKGSESDNIRNHQGEIGVLEARHTAGRRGARGDTWSRTGPAADGCGSSPCTQNRYLSYQERLDCEREDVEGKESGQCRAGRARKRHTQSAPHLLSPQYNNSVK